MSDIAALSVEIDAMKRDRERLDRELAELRATDRLILEKIEALIWKVAALAALAAGAGGTLGGMFGGP